MSFQPNSESNAKVNSNGVVVPCETPNCGFYGLTTKMNLCSQCYKEKLQELEKERTMKVKQSNSNLALDKEVVRLDQQKITSTLSSTTSFDLQVTPDEDSNDSVSKAQISQLLEKTHRPKVHSPNTSSPSSIINPLLRSLEESMKNPILDADLKKIVPTDSSSSNANKTAQVEHKVQPNKKRCFECNKFLGFTGIKCQCGFVYCGVHRYPEKHNCTFDFDARAKDKFHQNKAEAAVADKIGGERL